MKKCFKCQRELPLSDFYKHKQMSDGHVGKCKECNKLDVRKNRVDNIDYYRDYDRKRGNRQSKEYLQNYRLENPEKYKAHCMINNAIRDGKMTRKSNCEGCGDKCDTYGHHCDYSKPLDVVWLCPSCHKTTHALEDF